MAPVDMPRLLMAGVLLVLSNARFAVAGADKESTTAAPTSTPQVEYQVPLLAMDDKEKFAEACPDYSDYATVQHPPLSGGPMKLPFQRPSEHCRTFVSPLVEKVIKDITERMEDKDMARLFENAFPNTLDTTVRWHTDGSKNAKRHGAHHNRRDGKWEGAQSFIVTGDINAEWLRDSTNQLKQYQPLAKKDPKLSTLILGAINTQAEYVIESPYCNAFQPPPASQLSFHGNGQDDMVHPSYEPSTVFECKYELDSLAHFLAISNQYHNSTGSTEFLTSRWFTAVKTLLAVLDKQSEPTFDPESGLFIENEYTFLRRTVIGTETLGLSGVGNPLNNGTGLIRSAFRPSDDATILGFFIPANAMMSVELERAASVLESAKKQPELAKTLRKRGKDLRQAVWDHGVVEHKRYGKVFAFEVDGYGSHILMDDANIPSLLALPLLGFVPATDQTYKNTRRMILEKQGNPYYLEGPEFKGVGGPHIGLSNAWPMSLLVRAMTSDEDAEIRENLALVRDVSFHGLIHESVDVGRNKSFTRSWFAWANSVYAQTVLDLAGRKPELLFGKGAKPYRIE